MTQNFDESNILICGSPRVGKSSLINAICQEDVAISTKSLNSSTASINQYSFESSFGNLTHTTIFWDTPGIESWHGDDAHNYMVELIEKTQPICMIYCASPGSFVNLKDLVWMISECHKRNIFCALVCTNMWAGRDRQLAVDELCEVLNIVHPNLVSNKEDGIIYYDNVALVTMVNSTEYIDEDFNVRKAPSGINELIFGIAKCLQRDNMFAWLRTVSKNKSFWTKMSSKLGDLFNIPYKTFNTLYQSAENIFDYLFTFSANNQNYKSSNCLSMTKSITDNVLSTKNETVIKNIEDDVFHDTETNEIPKDVSMKKLSFVVKSEETLEQLNKALEQFGGKDIRTDHLKTEKEQKIEVTVKFDDTERIMAIYNLCRISINNQVHCSIINPSSNIEQ